MTDSPDPNDPRSGSDAGAPASADSVPADQIEAPERPEMGAAARFAAGVSEKGYGVESDEPQTVSYPGLRLAAVLAAIVALAVVNTWMFIVILAIATMITLHEFGHYYMAKRAGMKVTEFFLGFGPKIWSIRRGEVEYGIKLIPAGAYVKIPGMTNLEEIDPADEARTYRQKSFRQRVGVAVAGSTMHFLLAFVLIFLCLTVVGQPAGSLDPNVAGKQWHVQALIPDAPAAKAGLKRGDRIVTLDGKTVGPFTDVRDISTKVAGRQDKTVPITYLHRGHLVKTTITIQPFYNWSVDALVDKTGPAEALKLGDVILSINGTKVSHKTDLDPLLKQYDGQKVAIRFERDDPKRGAVEHTATVKVDRLILVGTKAYVGIEAEDAKKVKVGVIEGLAKTPGGFVDLARVSLGGLAHFFTPSGISSFANQLGNANKNHAAQEKADARPSLDHSSSRIGTPDTPALRGSNGGQDRLLSIVGLVKLGSSTGSFAPGGLLYLFAVINVFIGLFNLTPLLPFDGGHVMIAVYEKIQERRLHRRRYFTDVSKLLPVVYAVTAILLVLFATTIYLDVANPISG